MKVLIVNTNDIFGGAARAAYRLHRALREAGIETEMLVQIKQGDDETVFTGINRITKFLNRLYPFIEVDTFPARWYKNRTNTLFSPAWFGFREIVDKINEINPDIVHLHWITGGMIRIEDIARINSPIVWSMHDNWVFTGGCHIMWECEKYKTKCGACPRLGSNKVNDLSRWVWTRKQKTYNKKDFVVVGLSKWINECSKNSALLKNKRHVNLPNPLSTNIYKPFHKEKSRVLWSLPEDKKLLLFGAVNAVSDINKGFKQLSEALHKLTCKDVEFVVFGSSEPQNAPDFGFKTHYVGHLHDDVSLVTLYSAVDVMVVPSLQENLSNAIMESLACGTPVVAFDIGGNSDMIEHKQNGYLAKPFDTTDLKDGIEWVLNLSKNVYDELSHNARAKVVEKFDSKIVAKKYIELYKEILSDRS
jgi:glycosyltransferase involved in cell wall biosynthesis